MEFTEEQKSKIREWVEEGCGLSEIQRRINNEFGISMTYMDVRFLILDLGLTIKDGSETEEKEAAADTDSTEATPQNNEEPESDRQGGVRVELDALMRPGAIVSGTVVFSDGVSAVWMLDQMGRLAIEPSQPGYKPGEADNAEFVAALKDALAAKGFGA